MKYIKLFEKQLELFGDEYQKNVYEILNKKVDEFIAIELKKSVNSIVNKSFIKWFEEKRRLTRNILNENPDTQAEYLTEFIYSEEFINLKEQLLDKYYDYMEDILKRASIRISKDPTDTFNIKFKDLFKMYKEHDVQKVINEYVIKYFTKLFDKEPAIYMEIRNNLPMWVKKEFPDKERGASANLWDLTTK